MPPSPDLVGKQFNRLLVNKRIRKAGRILWSCSCECGSEKKVLVDTYELLHSKVRSCGCYAREQWLKVITKHGKHGTLEYELWETAKARATKQKIPFTITVYDIPEIPTVCPVLNIPLFKGSRKEHPNSPSLDKLDPKKGYVPGNIKVISWRANDVRGNATAEELGKVYKYAREVESERAFPNI